MPQSLSLPLHFGVGHISYILTLPLTSSQYHYSNVKNSEEVPGIFPCCPCGI
uniref:Uncharacterized protein n=1 Tax=Anguilla anguilla TaxID=7936 RepID=A0A0E9PEU4_ANGAN